MVSNKLCLKVVSLITISFVLNSTAFGQFTDDFSDGSITDGKPVTWSAAAAPFHSGSIELIDNHLTLTPSTEIEPFSQFEGYHEIDAVVKDKNYYDISITTKFKLDSGTELVAIYARDASTTNQQGRTSSIYGGVSNRGVLRMGYTIRNTSSVSDSEITEVPSPVVMGIDTINLKLEVIGDTASLYAWPEGSTEPTTPQISKRLSRTLANKSGGFGLIVGSYANTVPVSFEYFSATPLNLNTGDFDGDNLLNLNDISLLSNAIKAQDNNLFFDLNGDKLVNSSDLNTWVKDLKNTWIGDANLDGQFDSTDFVEVFQAGKFETDSDASWNEGDWNADGKFDSSDYVAAFQDGGFEMGIR